EIQQEMSDPTLSSDQQPPDPHLQEITYRVLVPWYQLLQTPGSLMPTSRFQLPQSTHAPITLEELSLFILVDLGDFLNKYLSDVFQALLTGSATQFPNDSMHTARLALLRVLLKITVTIFPGAVASSKRTCSLSEALSKLRPYLQLAQGVGDDPPD